MKPTAPVAQCSGMIYTNARARPFQCGRRGAVVEDRKPYCRQHAPSAITARAAARDAQWRAGCDRDEAHREAVEECVAALREFLAWYGGSTAATATVTAALTRAYEALRALDALDGMHFEAGHPDRGGDA